MFFWLLGCCLRLLATVPGFSWNLTSFSVLDLVTLRMPGMLQLSWLRRNLHQEWRIFQGKIIDPNGTFSSKPCLSTGGYFDGSVRDWKRVESGTEHG